MIAKIWKYLKKEPYLWIAALPVAIFMLIVWLPYTVTDWLGKLGVVQLPPWLNILFQNLNSLIASAAPIIVYIAFVLLFRFVNNKTDELNKKAEQLVKQTDQSIIRLIEGTESVKSEFTQLLSWAKNISFYGPLDNKNGFTDILLSKKSDREISIYDTFINTKDSLENLLVADSHSKFNYNFCLYKQVVGVVIGYKEGDYRQLLFFRDGDSDELMGITLNKKININVGHLKDDIEMGVGPAIDFNNQIVHVRATLDQTLKLFWKTMRKGWTHPIMPPCSDNDPWNAQILSFFHQAAQTIAQDFKTKRVVITWRLTDDALDQAKNISSWLDYLKNVFSTRGEIKRIVLIDKLKYKTNAEYKEIVDNIRRNYFSELLGSYKIEYRNLSSEITTNGFDFAIFYDNANNIIAVQGSTYEHHHKHKEKELLRIYFARDNATLKEYTQKYQEIKNYEDISSVFTDV